MDKEAIATCAAYRKIEKKHLEENGYFSGTVITEAEQILGMSEEERLAFFKDLFNSTYDLAQQLIKHPRAQAVVATEHKIDLEKEGLGAIHFALYEDLGDDSSDNQTGPYRSIDVRAASFSPAPRSGAGLNSSNWGEQVHADADGSFSQQYGGGNFEEQLLRLLDARETLDVTHAALLIEAN